MNIQNNKHNYTPQFRGLDARPLKAIVMTSNHAGIADEMKRIGELENFKIYLLTQTSKGFQLLTDKFETSTHNGGKWAQDYFGIVGNTLLEFENTEKSKLLKRLFNFKPNPVQEKFRKEMNYAEVQTYVDFLYNLPQTTVKGEPGVILNNGDKNVFINKSTFENEFELHKRILKNIITNSHVKGGNYFLTENSDGTTELLIGQNELKKFSIEQIKKMFQVDKVHVLPQADYHLDLFIRPLKDKKVLIADDERAQQILEEAFKKIEKTILASPQNERLKFKEAYIQTGIYSQSFKKILSQNPYTNINEVEKALKEAGYETIKVPARIFETYSNGKNEYGATNYLLKNLLNFINAHVHINDKGETVYITNKSNIDEVLGLTEEIQKLTGVSVEKMFLDSYKPYVDKIYTVSGKNNAIAKEILPEYFGGIHCMGMEFPKEL